MSGTSLSGRTSWAGDSWAKLSIRWARWDGGRSGGLFQLQRRGSGREKRRKKGKHFPSHILPFWALHLRLPRRVAPMEWAGHELRAAKRSEFESSLGNFVS